MNIEVRSGALGDHPCEAVVLGFHEGERSLGSQASALDDASQGLLSGVLAQGDFKGKLHQTLLLHTPQSPCKRVMLTGLGKPGELNLDTLRQAAGKAAGALREVGVKSFTVALADGLGEAVSRNFETAEVAQALAEGTLLSLYQMQDYFTRDRDELKKVEAVCFWSGSQMLPEAFEAGIGFGQTLAEVIHHVRDLVARPGNVVTATRLAEEAKTAGGAAGLEVTVLDKAQIAELGMGGLLGVNQGSVEPPQFIVMAWQGGKSEEAPVAIIGKGVTFDTGGISIKPGEGMDKMKYDMAGAAATIGILCAVARMKLPLNVIGLIPATDNMPSGSALKPGDVLTTYSGQTVEVLNTDAEGRLILCDAITYAVRDKKAQAIIDLATLTGACVIALGTEGMAVLGNQQVLVDRVLAAGQKTGDRGWQLPLWKEYNELLRSDIADMKNIGGREAGTITAACFLQRFTEGTPWCHLDIAGTAWTEKDKPYRPKGPTGYPVRAVVEVLRHWQPLA